MEDAIQVAFLVMISLLGGGLGTIAVVGVAVMASRRRD